MAQKIKGKCKFCGSEYTYSYMGRHLSSCKKRQTQLTTEAGKKRCGYFLLAIYPRYNKDYWLFIEANENTTLLQLDSFLRDIWLECCGHLSAFDIDGVCYELDSENDDFWDDPVESMNYTLRKVLCEDMTFLYEYDFGDTTELLITVVNYTKKGLQKKTITLLSRNNPHEYICEDCGKKTAVVLCQECYYDNGGGFLCEDCMKVHTCGEEMQLKICNSPRMGVCAYNGSDKYPDQFIPDADVNKK